MVMRSDGGATDLAGFRAAPARTLYSGPAAIDVQGQDPEL
jgi:N-methylhydantoinase A/oxoprolinase/acetone carboxylase beta subunit